MIFHSTLIKSLLYSRDYAEAGNERLSTWAIQLRKNIADVASRWQHCVRFDRPTNRTHDLPDRQRSLLLRQGWGTGGAQRATLHNIFSGPHFLLIFKFCLKNTQYYVVKFAEHS